MLYTRLTLVIILRKINRFGFKILTRAKEEKIKLIFAAKYYLLNLVNLIKNKRNTYEIL